MVAFVALQSLGWSEGRNIRVNIQWGSNDLEHQRKFAAELMALPPEIILESGTASVTAIEHNSRHVPVVFVRVADPVGSGFVTNLAHPGGNITDFILFEYSLGAKWLELLK